jgi:hypothetical protein
MVPAFLAVLALGVFSGALLVMADWVGAERV